MKRAAAITALLAFTALLFAQPAFAGIVGKRQLKQEKRIAQGIRSGELTRGETRQILRQQHRIQRHKRLARADGELTRKEKARLEMHQDRASANIYRLKHNDRNRF
jgi:hypothetical protein